MANMMLNPPSNGCTRKVRGLMNPSGGNPTDSLDHQMPNHAEGQRTSQKSFFERFIPPRNLWQSFPTAHVARHLDTLPRSLQTPNNVGVSYVIKLTGLNGLAGADRSRSRRKPSTEEMARVDVCMDALQSAGTSGGYSIGSLLGSPDLSPMPGGDQPGPQGPFQGGATAAGSPVFSPVANFDDEDPLPLEPVDCWEELDESSPTAVEKALPGEILDSPEPCESAETCFEGEDVLVAQAQSDTLTQNSQLADSPDRDLHKEIKAKTPDRETAKKCSKKPEQSDLSKVLFDRKPKSCGKNKRRRQLKKSKKCSSGPDQESKSTDTFSALEDSDSDDPPASLEKDGSEGDNDDDEDFDFLTSGLSFCGLGNFLPGCQQPAKSAPPPPPAPDPLRCQDPDSEFTPSARIQEMNQAWGIDLAVPWERPPRKSRVCFAEGQDLATEYVQEDWDPEYRAACVGHWHLLAVDRQRFQERIARVGQQMDWVLVPQHRAAVYSKRFSSPDKCTH